MGDGGTNPLANVPPWVFVLLLLGGGGGVGALTGINLGGHPELEDVCEAAEARADAAEQATQAALSTIQTMIKALQECKTSGWIE